MQCSLLLANADANPLGRKACSTQASSGLRGKHHLRDLTLKTTQQTGKEAEGEPEETNEKSHKIRCLSSRISNLKTIRLRIQTNMGEMFKEIKDGITKRKQVIKDY